MTSTFRMKTAHYISATYADVAEELGVLRLSVGWSGPYLDNAVAESWFAVLKNEMFHRYRFPRVPRPGSR